MGQDVVDNDASIGGFGGAREAGKIIRQETGQRPDGRRYPLGGLPGPELEFVEQGLETVAAGRVDEGAQTVALAYDFGEQGIEPGFAAAFQHSGEGLGQFRVAGGGARNHVAARGGEQRRLHLRVEHFEMGRNVGLQRKLVQHRFAEGVDGLDLQPARCFQRLGEQAPRPAHGVAIGPATVQRLDPRRQFRVAKRRPFRQCRKHPVRHVGCGGAGVGQAQDLRRIGAAQQQPDDALGQHMGLARSGIGRHPGRIPGVGGARLAGRRVGRDGIGFLHASPPSSPASPPADHSSTRARWS